jgi:hypothetical protein
LQPNLRMNPKFAIHTVAAACDSTTADLLAM